MENTPYLEPSSLDDIPLLPAQQQQESSSPLKQGEDSSDQWEDIETDDTNYKSSSLSSTVHDDGDEEKDENVGTESDEQEDPDEYKKGGYHPVNIGDVYHGRYGQYSVLRKIGRLYKEFKESQSIYKDAVINK